MKHLVFILCAMMTCIIIASSLFLPQLGFSFLDRQKENDVFIEQSAAVTPAENLTQDDKLMVIAQSYGYKEAVPSRSSGFFMKTGNEIAEQDLLKVIHRELLLLDPSDYLGYIAALKRSGDDPQINASLVSIVQYNETPLSFPVWNADVQTGGVSYRFTLDAVSGKIYAVYAFLSDASYGNEADGITTMVPSGDEEGSVDGVEQYKLFLGPNELLLEDFGNYLGYDGGPAGWVDAGYGLEVSGFVYPLDHQKFSLVCQSSGYDLSLNPMYF